MISHGRSLRTFLCPIGIKRLLLRFPLAHELVCVPVLVKIVLHLHERTRVHSVMCRPSNEALRRQRLVVRALPLAALTLPTGQNISAQSSQSHKGDELR